MLSSNFGSLLVDVGARLFWGDPTKRNHWEPNSVTLLQHKLMNLKIPLLLQNLCAELSQHSLRTITVTVNRMNSGIWRAHNHYMASTWSLAMLTENQRCLFCNTLYFLDRKIHNDSDCNKLAFENIFFIILTLNIHICI